MVTPTFYSQTNLINTIGYYTKDKKDSKKLDIVIVEATAITEDGWIVPGASVGATPELVQMADKIIIEVNTRIPSFEGLHDISMCSLPPNRKPYLIMNTEDRIGTVSKFRVWCICHIILFTVFYF